ncbi:MAG: hypothetical protein IKA17_05305 [Clostridia bacterium]|nr:hypothetical protein [Clostridia bacterium]
MIKVFYSHNIEESGAFIKKALNKAGYTDIEIKRTQNGKPYTDENVFFSLSHTENFIICAVSDFEIGIDAEKMRCVEKRGIISKKFLKIENELSDKEFLELWTKHESKIKFYGKKLFSSLDEAEINTHTFMIEDYIVSVCAENTENIETEMI